MLILFFFKKAKFPVKVAYLLNLEQNTDLTERTFPHSTIKKVTRYYLALILHNTGVTLPTPDLISKLPPIISLLPDYLKERSTNHLKETSLQLYATIPFQVTSTQFQNE